MIEIVQKLLADRGPELIECLMGNAGFRKEEAQSFLPAAAETVINALKGGGFDVGELLGGGGAGSVLAALNPGELAAETGVDAAKAEAGLGELVPRLLAGIGESSGGADALVSALGGGDAAGLLGGAGNLAAKLFK